MNHIYPSHYCKKLTCLCDYNNSAGSIFAWKFKGKSSSYEKYSLGTEIILNNINFFLQNVWFAIGKFSSKCHIFLHCEINICILKTKNLTDTFYSLLLPTNSTKKNPVLATETWSWITEREIAIIFTSTKPSWSWITYPSLPLKMTWPKFSHPSVEWRASKSWGTSKLGTASDSVSLNILPLKTPQRPSKC